MELIGMPASGYALLQGHSQAAEQLPAFVAAPHGEGVYPAAQTVAGRANPSVP